MRLLSIPAVLLIAWLGVGLDCREAQAQATVAEFKFPRGLGSLQLLDQPCANARIIGLYGDDVPEPFLAGTLVHHGRVLGGCWYQADGRIFFTDNEGALLIPPPPIERLSPATNRVPSLAVPGRAARRD